MEYSPARQNRFRKQATAILHRNARNPYVASRLSVIFPTPSVHPWVGLLLLLIHRHFSTREGCARARAAAIGACLVKGFVLIVHFG